MRRRSAAVVGRHASTRAELRARAGAVSFARRELERGAGPVPVVGSLGLLSSIPGTGVRVGGSIQPCGRLAHGGSTSLNQGIALVLTGEA
jgi:hypothetical protein